MSSKRRRNPYLRIAGFVVYGLVLIFTLAFGSVVGWMSRTETGKALLNQVNPITKPKSPGELFGSKDSPSSDLTILVLGCDVDYNNKNQVTNKLARSDMMMVVRMDFVNNRIGAVSIPRDTLCELPGYQRQKINAYSAIGGPDLSKRAVEHLLPGVDVDRVVVLDFQAFQDLIDMVGGVTVYVPRRMKYDDNWGNLHIDLQKGQQHLDGYEAMGYVRWRKNNRGVGGSETDMERHKRQQELMMAMKEQMMRNPTKLPEILESARKLSGNSFSGEELVSLMFFAQKIGADNIKMGGIPVVDAPNFNLEVDRNELNDVLSTHGMLPGSYRPLVTE